MTISMFGYPQIKSEVISLDMINGTYFVYNNFNIFQFFYNLSEKSSNYKDAYFDYFDKNSMIVDLWDANNFFNIG